MQVPYGLQLNGLYKSFNDNRSGRVFALRDINAEIQPSEFAVIVGPNGSGKTTLLNIVAGEHAPDAGYVRLLGKDGAIRIDHLPAWTRARHVARVYQDPSRGTAAGLTVWENLRLACVNGSIPSPFRFVPRRRNKAWFRERLRRIGLEDKMPSRVADLSQGQRQLLALELVMVRNPVPSLLLLDEHTASLDQTNARQCLEATARLCRETGTTVLMVTHDLTSAIRYGDRLLVLREGRLAADVHGNEKQRLDAKALFEMCGHAA